jgi:hypothetical protein
MSFFHSLLSSSQGVYTPSVELQAWMDQVTTDGGSLPSLAVQEAIDELLATSLESGTILSRMKTGNFHFFGNSLTWRRNIKDPATFRYTISGTLTFTDGFGVKSDGSSFIVHPFKTDQYAGIESDLFCIQYISEDATFTSTFSHGVRTRSDINSGFRLQPFNISNSGLVGNHQTLNQAYTNSSKKGLYIHGNNGTHDIMWKDGVKTSTARVPEAPNLTNDRSILAHNSRSSNGAALGVSAMTDASLAAHFLFDKFSDTDASLFKTAWDAFRVSVGLSLLLLSNTYVTLADSLITLETI